MKILRILAIVIGVYVLLGLSLDAALGYFQPRDETTAVLRTFDATGQVHETVLRPRNGDGRLWLVSGQWFRGWYHRALANPDVELARGNTVTAYRATPVDSPEVMAAMLRLERDNTSAVRYWFGRAVLTLFAPVKLLQLDPREQAANSAADAAADIHWFEGSIDAAFAKAAAEDKPVFLYWGAQWCPPCHELKAYVFSRPEFRDRMRLFVPLYLDGDAPGAQKAAEEFGVIGYPTVVVVDPARHEIARIAGGMDLSRYGDVLDLALESMRPTNEILATLESAQPVTLDDGECRRLAYNGWILDSRAERPAALSEALVRAAAACPDALQRERDRLTLTAAALASSAEQASIQAGEQPSEQLRQLVAAVDEIVADPPRALGNGDATLYLDAPYFAAAKALRPDDAPALLSRWLALMSALQTDARYSAPQQLQAMAMKLQAATGLGESGPTLESLQADARVMLDAVLARDYDEHARVGIINAALWVTHNLNDPARTLAILEPEIAHSKTPYYYMLDMADLEESAGRTAQAVDWLDRAYHAAQGPATKFQWGALYLQGLLRMTPDDVSRIQAAALEVAAGIDAQNGVYQRTRLRLGKLAAALREWSATPERTAAYEAIRDHIEAACNAATAADPTAATCETLFAT